MNIRSLTARRPSAAIVIASAALFVSLGGVGYAAVAIPANSVGTSQLQNDSVSYQKVQPSSIGSVRLADNGVSTAKIPNAAVTYQKIAPAAVGSVRANLSQLQARLSTSCAAGSAIGAVDDIGRVTCNSALPAEYGTASNTAAVSAAVATISSVNLPSGPTYLALANPTATVTSSGTPQRVAVTCTLTAGTNAVTRSFVVPTDATAGSLSTASLPLQIAGTSGAATLACSDAVPNGATPPATTVTSAINALATASNN